MILLALALAQDPATLAWRFDQAVEVRWSSETSGPDLELKVEIHGTLELEEAGNPARLAFRPRRVRMSGRAGREPIDVREDERLTAPLRFRGTPLGRFVPEGDHPLRDLVAGRGVFLGPELPEHPLRPGDAWRAPMQSGKASPVETAFRAVSREGGVVRATAAEEPVPGTRMRVDGLFDAAAGRWTAVTTTAESGETRTVIRLAVGGK